MVVNGLELSELTYNKKLTKNELSTSTMGRKKIYGFKIELQRSTLTGAWGGPLRTSDVRPDVFSSLGRLAP